MLKEIIYENDLPINAEILTVKSYPIHMHHDIQLLYVLEGELDLTLAFQTYRLKENDFHYIHSEDLHAIHSISNHNTVLVLSINTDYIEKLYPQIRTTVFTMTTDKSLLLYSRQQMELKTCIFLLLHELIQKNDDYSERIEEITKTLLEILHKYFRGFTVDRSSRSFVHKRLQDIRQTERLCGIISDIYTNYVEPSTLEEIASQQKLNLYYLSHLFSQTLGINYRDFVNMVRVETSEYDLLASDLSVSHIALSSGFSNTRYYIKHFTYWFGMTPQEYRQKHIGSTILKKQPNVSTHNLSEYSDFIASKLKFLTAACPEFTAVLASDTISLGRIQFEKGVRLSLNLTCYNPDLLSVQDSYFQEKSILSPDFMKKYLHFVKIIIEEPLPQNVNRSDNEFLTSIKELLADLTHKSSCEFSLGVNPKHGALFTESNIKTPLFYVLEFLARDYDKLHVSPSFIVLKEGDNYHILCWNLHLSQTKKFTIKEEGLGKNRMIRIAALNVDYELRKDQGRNYLTPWKNARLPDAMTKTAEKILAPKENLQLIEHGQEFTVTTQLEKKSLCFIDILVL